jgi:myo-inositol-1(or 4)-monophosphatase
MVARSVTVEVMISAARKAGDCLLHDFARLDEQRVVEKNPSDFVSSADFHSQEVLRAELAAGSPDCDLIVEEDDRRHPESARSRFVVDPLDGTTNFLHGIPHFAVSIGLVVGREVVAGVVFDPPKGELFWAEKGRGAWLADRRLCVSSERTLSRSIFGTGIPHHGTARHEEYLKALARVMSELAGVRRLGAAALDLAYVAAGRFEAFFDMGLSAWDVAAGELLVREAGGLVTREDGSEFMLEGGDVLATSGEPLHRTAVDLLAPLHASPRGR